MTDTSHSSSTGCCWLIGAGPGDPGLLTLRGRECIEQADVVVYDYLCNPALLQYARADAEIVYVGKKAGAHTLSQEGINGLLVKYGSGGKKVARLKGGDPFVFGRGGEEAEELVKAGVPFEVVPGVTSAIAGPAYAGIPVTHREHAAQLTFVTGHEDPTKSESSLNLAQLAKAPGTKVILMGVERIAAITKGLIAGGAAQETPVALVRWATTGRQETLEGTLGNIASRAEEAQFKAPAVFVVGEVVKLRASLNWFEKRPLLGKRIVVTRSRKQAGVLSASLTALGADVLELPTIRIEPPSEPKLFAQFVADAHRYDWLVFTSPNGVDAFFEVFYKLFNDAREIGGVKIAAIGPATSARVRHYHLNVDLQPEKFVAEEIVKQFQSEMGTLENLQFLLVRAEEAREVLPEQLTTMGAIVDEAKAYKTVPEERDPTGAAARIRDEGVDLVTFTSSSTVRNFAALGLPWQRGMVGASIGPITSGTMEELGIPIAIEARRHDIPGLVESIAAYFAGEEKG